MQYRFHVLGIPHTATNHDYLCCAFTQKVLKFCKMMKERGHYIIHYGHENSDVLCDEHVTLTTNGDLIKSYGSLDYFKKEFFKFNNSDHCYNVFNENGKIEILKRIQTKDFVLPFFGVSVDPIIKEAEKTGKVIIVEPGIGYNNPVYNFRIYESWAVAHHTMGLQNVKQPSYYQCVIPNYFDTKDFEFCHKKEDYFLYLGRICSIKGVDIAIQVTKHIGAKLIIAGQGDICKEFGYSEVPDHVEYVGYADIEKRKQLMKNAKGLFLMSKYVEPFGGVTIEAMLSGTPVIVSDWGCFTETVPHGLVGYRCRTFEQTCWAAKNITNIDPLMCRKWAENNYSFSKVGFMYEEFFYQLYNLWKKGWYEPNESRQQLSWNNYIFEKKAKIAIWIQTDWAFGRIYTDLKKYLTNYCIDIFDWKNSESNKLFFTSKWKEYDVIMSNSCILNNKWYKHYVNNTDLQKLLTKTIATIHAPENKSKLFIENIDDDKTVDLSMLTGVSKQIVHQLQTKYNLSEVLYTPVGVDIESFNKHKEVSKIKNVGFIGEKNNDSTEDAKNSKLFHDICTTLNLNPIYIYDKPIEFTNELYENIDMLICTSNYEGGPLGIFEAGACGVPVLSTNVGNIRELKHIKTFSTAEEACKIIRELNSNENTLKEYCKTVTTEIRTYWNWQFLCEKYWNKAINKKLNS